MIDTFFVSFVLSFYVTGKVCLRVNHDAQEILLVLWVCVNPGSSCSELLPAVICLSLQLRGMTDEGLVCLMAVFHASFLCELGSVSHAS